MSHTIGPCLPSTVSTSSDDRNEEAEDDSQVIGPSLPSTNTKDDPHVIGPSLPPAIAKSLAEETASNVLDVDDDDDNFIGPVMPSKLEDNTAQYNERLYQVRVEDAIKEIEAKKPKREEWMTVAPTKKKFNIVGLSDDMQALSNLVAPDKEKTPLIELGTKHKSSEVIGCEMPPKQRKPFNREEELGIKCFKERPDAPERLKEQQEAFKQRFAPASNK